MRHFINDARLFHPSATDAPDDVWTDGMPFVAADAEVTEISFIIERRHALLHALARLAFLANAVYAVLGVFIVLGLVERCGYLWLRWRRKPGAHRRTPTLCCQTMESFLTPQCPAVPEHHSPPNPIVKIRSSTRKVDPTAS